MKRRSTRAEAKALARAECEKLGWPGGWRRGNAASFGLFGSLGEPLVLGMNGRDPVYLLIDFRWFTGINQARRWAPVLQEWLARKLS